MRHYQFLSLLVLIMACSFAKAQDYNFVSWQSIEINKKLSDKNNLQFLNQVRMSAKVKHFDSFLQELIIDHKVNTWLKIAGGYRFTFKETNNLNHRFYFQASAYKELKKSLFQSRIIYQIDYNRLFQTQHYLRYRFLYFFSFTDFFKFYSGFELWYALQLNNEQKFSRMRPMIGIVYNFNKNNAIEAAAYYQNNLQKSNSLNEFILHIKYVCRF